MIILHIILVSLTLFAAEDSQEEWIFQSQHANWYKTNNAACVSQPEQAGLHVFLTDTHDTFNAGEPSTLASILYKNATGAVQKVCITESLSKGQNPQLTLVVKGNGQSVTLLKKQIPNCTKIPPEHNLQLSVIPRYSKEVLRYFLPHTKDNFITSSVAISCEKFPCVQISLTGGDHDSPVTLTFFDNEKDDDVPSRPPFKAYQGQTCACVPLPPHLAFSPPKDPSPALRTLRSSLYIDGTIFAYAPEPLPSPINACGVIGASVITQKTTLYMLEKADGCVSLNFCSNSAACTDTLFLPERYTPGEPHHIALVLQNILKTTSIVIVFANPDAILTLNTTGDEIQTSLERIVDDI